MTPPAAATARSSSSGRARRLEKTAAGRVWESRTGWRLSARTARRVSAWAWATSTTAPQPVQLPHDVAAEGGESAVTRRLGHDVAQLVDAVVDQLDHADAPVVEVSHARQVALERIRALEGENRARRARSLALDHVRG